MDSVSDSKSFSGELYKSTVYSAAEGPALGIAQLLDGGDGKVSQGIKQAFNKIGVAAPEQADFNTSGWYGQVIGGAVGMVVPVGLLGKGSRALLHSSSEVGILSQRAAIGFSLKESVLTGGLYGGLLTPSEGKNLLPERITNAAMYAETFGLLTGSNILISKMGVKNPIVSGVLSGLPGGVINAENDALKQGNFVFDREQLAKEVYTMSIVGGLFGAKAKFLDKAPVAVAEKTAAPNEQPAPGAAAPETPIQLDTRSVRLLERLRTSEKTGQSDAVATDEAAALVKLNQQSREHATELAGIVGARGQVSNLVADYLLRMNLSEAPKKADVREIHSKAEEALAARRTFEEWQSQTQRRSTEGITHEEATVLQTVHALDPKTAEQVISWLGQRNETSGVAARNAVDALNAAERPEWATTLDYMVDIGNERAISQVNATHQLFEARNAATSGQRLSQVTVDQARALVTLGEINPEAGRELATILGSHDPANKLLADRLLRHHEDPLPALWDVESKQDYDAAFVDAFTEMAEAARDAQRGLEMLQKPQTVQRETPVPYEDMQSYAALRNIGLREESDAFESMIAKKHGAQGDLALSMTSNWLGTKEEFEHSLSQASRFIETAKAADNIAAAYEQALAGGASPSAAAKDAFAKFPLPTAERTRAYGDYVERLRYDVKAYEKLTSIVPESEIAALQTLAEHAKPRSQRLSEVIGARGAEAKFIARYLADAPYTSKEDMTEHITPLLDKFGDALRLTQELTDRKTAGKDPIADRVSLREAQAILALETSHFRYFEAISKDAEALREMISERGPRAQWILKFLRSRHAFSAEQRFGLDEHVEVNNAARIAESHYNFTRGRRIDNARAFDLSHQLGPIAKKHLEPFINLSNRLQKSFESDTPKLSNETLLEMAKDPRLEHVDDGALPGIYARMSAFGRDFTYDMSPAELTAAGGAWQFEASLPAEIAKQVGLLPVNDRVAAAAAWLKTSEGVELRSVQMLDANVRSNALQDMPAELAALRSLSAEQQQMYWQRFSGTRNNPVHRNVQDLHNHIAIRPILDYLYPDMTNRDQFASTLNQSTQPFYLMTHVKPRDFDAAFTYLNEMQREGLERRDAEDNSPYLAFLRPQEDGTHHLVDPGTAALQLSKTFGGGWKEWLAAQNRLGRTLHDSTYWLPANSYNTDGLGQFLRDNSPRAVNKLEIIAKRWREVPPAMRDKSYDDVLQHLLSVSYPGAKDVKFAEEAASWGVSMDDYPEWESRYLAAKDTPSPFPTGKAWAEGNLVARFLRRDDPRGLFLGQYTNCCQHPGNEHGAASAWNGLENPKAGYFVVERVDPKDKNAPREIIAQSWAWVSDAGGLVFDNVEAKSLGPREDSVRKLYQRAAVDLTEQFPVVTLGTTHGDLNVDSLPNAGDAFQKLPKGYTGNSDARDKQVLLARRDQ